jgi:CheY-like chemotaxis protein
MAGKHHPTPLSILLADDTRDLQALATAWLEEAGHRVTPASCGREIVQLVEQHSFDLVVTDILMPDGDGWDAIRDVHRLRPETRILAISGGAREMPAAAVLRVARGAGAIGLLQKPFSRPQFLESIERVMRTPAAIAETKSAR